MVLGFFVSVNIQADVRHAGPVTRPAGNDLERLIFVLGAKPIEAVSLAATTDAKRIEVRIFEVKRFLNVRKSLKYSSLFYHLSGNRVSHITAYIDPTPENKKYILEAVQAIKKASRPIIWPKAVKKPENKSFVMIGHTEKHFIIAGFDSPDVRDMWSVRFFLTEKPGKQNTTQPTIRGIKTLSSKPAERSSSSKPAVEDPKRGWYVIAGIPVCLGLNGNKLASGLKAFKLQPSDVLMYDVSLRLTGRRVVKLKNLSYEIIKGVVYNVSADVSEKEKNIKKLIGLYEALRKSGKLIGDAPRKTNNIFIKVLVPMRRTGKDGSVIISWGYLEGTDLFPPVCGRFIISASLGGADKKR